MPEGRQKKKARESSFSGGSASEGPLMDVQANAPQGQPCLFDIVAKIRGVRSSIGVIEALLDLTFCD